MGTALMVEGILSGCYHICPTHANYQFGKLVEWITKISKALGNYSRLEWILYVADTTFMYAISMLCMLKIYQTRHPDINADAHAAFAVLAFVVLLGVISVFEDSFGFRIVFAGIHLLACLALSTQIYYMGRWKLSKPIYIRLLYSIDLIVWS